MTKMSDYPGIMDVVVAGIFGAIIGHALGTTRREWDRLRGNENRKPYR
jgi:hypothetical protein